MLHDFEQRYADARAEVVADVSLFLLGQDEEDTAISASLELCAGAGHRPRTAARQIAFHLETN
jgi:hypothetical protein